MNANFNDVWERLVEATDIRFNKDLAEIVDVTPQYVSQKRRKNEFPFGWAYLVAQKYNLLTEWIITGKPPKNIEGKKKDSLHFQILNDLDEWLQELVVGEPYRKEWFRASIEDSFPMFREWKKRKENEEGRSDIDPQSNVA
ncbi:helix-turn-helix domain-containing protein [Desulfofustis glycolicus]|uniref:Bacteriophage CI repressor helix-turn-helix domain-containing protein n=1 Tax=Desulfofustis glycolicus DSM 9705 TaxID=1121409 RepID=A0A1M5SFY9_9BACT|nr:helix-turn-helix domain-containing protein [Desulfofustis glycolicus]SHH37507.1 Bacteriophage CI repressor helix-turn-helix domain-containing protein [Desulfofustis glycolicus DSM 9705]